MAHSRLPHIDTIRAFAIIVIIITHVLASFWDHPVLFFIWNYIHFVVPAIVFSSAYVLTAAYDSQLRTRTTIIHWYRNRIIRLLKPYYIYLAVHALLVFLLPLVFSGRGMQFTVEYFFRSVTLTGGVDLSWFPLLFLQLTVLFPVMIRLTRNRWWLFLYTTTAIVAVICVVFFYPPIRAYSAAIMWIPWSLILVMGIVVYRLDAAQKRELRRNFLIAVFVFCCGVFSSLALWMALQSREIVLTHHKYPPNAVYFSYSVGLTTLLILLSQPLTRLLTHAQREFVRFMSEQSYSLFFIHYIVLDAVQTIAKRWHPAGHVWFQVPMVLIMSLTIARGLSIYTRRK